MAHFRKIKYNLSIGILYEYTAEVTYNLNFQRTYISSFILDNIIYVITSNMNMNLNSIFRRYTNTIV